MCHADDGQEIPCKSSGQGASFDVGTPWLEPRFILHNDEVADNLSGLIIINIALTLQSEIKTTPVDTVIPVNTHATPDQTFFLT